jgi:signal transduction histidine kinase
MKSLYLRIWLTVIAALLAFALASGWLVQRHMEQERQRAEAALAERMEAWGDLIQRSIPGPDAPPALQAQALNEWSQRLRIPLALDDARGQRIGASDLYQRRVADAPMGGRRGLSVRLDDGRVLWVLRGPRARERLAEPAGPADMSPRADFRPGPPLGPPPGAGPGPGPGRWERGAPGSPPPWWAMGVFASLREGVGLAALLVVLFLAVAAGAYPVVRRLTRRLEALKQGVEAFGEGALHHRVTIDGRDEVAAVAESFNRSAARVEALVRSHQSLLANASHELRSPLARMKMAVALLGEVEGAAQREALSREIHTNIAELDALVEEVLLASRLDAGVRLEHAPVELLAVCAEEASRLGASAAGQAAPVQGDERMLRRAVRNLLENARRYGGDDVSVEVQRTAAGGGEVRVCDRGAGVPPQQRERIFEPFYRMPGHAETQGGVGLGLSLVRQIAHSHGGSVRCEAREGGGSCFVLELPAAGRAAGRPSGA